MIFAQDRISYKLAIVCVAATFVLGIIFGLAQVASDLNDEIEDTNDRIFRILNAAKINATSAALRLDEIQASEIVKGLFVHDFIIAAKIKDERNDILAQLNRESEPSNTLWLTEKFSNRSTIDRQVLFAPGNDKKVIGTLEVHVDFDNALKSFYERATFVLASGIVRNLILGGILVILFYIFVTRALLQLADLVHDIDPSNLSGRAMPIPPGHGKDEIGQVFNSINSFVETMAINQVQRAKAEDELIKAHNELEVRVEERTRELQSQITERKYIEKTLRDREQMLRLITDNLPIQIAYIDANFTYRFVNAQYEKDFDRPRSEIIGMKVEEFWGKDVWEHYKSYADKLLAGQQTVIEYEYSVMIKNKPNIRKATYITDFNEENEIIGYYVLSEDITLARKREEELEGARIFAESANRSKSEFLANMSHELRTPLNAIIGFSEVLHEKIFGEMANEQQAEYVQNIHESGEHLLALINDILDVSAIEAEKTELTETRLSLRRTTEAALRMITDRADQRKIKLSDNISLDIPSIYADERRLKQILVNLLSNAVKFTEPGGTVSIDANLNIEGNLTITVQDTGIGMDRRGLAKAMEKFGQIPSATSDPIEGTGLGLPLTKGLVEAHGGTLEIRSKKGSGTKVIIILPKERIIS